MKIRLLAFSIFVTNQTAYKPIIKFLRQNNVDIFNLFNRPLDDDTPFSAVIATGQPVQEWDPPTAKPANTVSSVDLIGNRGSDFTDDAWDFVTALTYQLNDNVEVQTSFQYNNFYGVDIGRYYLSYAGLDSNNLNGEPFGSAAGAAGAAGAEDEDSESSDPHAASATIATEAIILTATNFQMLFSIKNSPF